MIREAIKDTILSIPEETDKEGAEEAPIPKDTIVRDLLPSLFKDSINCVNQGHG